MNGNSGGAGDGVRPTTENDFSGRASAVVQASAIHGSVIFQAPAAAAPSPAPAMAPALPSRFVPRAAVEHRLLAELLRPGARDVVLSGAGGYGKTTAASWACRQPQTRERFPGGVLWVELGPTPGVQRTTNALDGLTAVLAGSTAGPHPDVPSAVGAFRNALPDLPVLLAVDDVWSEADLRPFLGAGDRVTVLATTRRSGLLDGTEIRVDAMSEQESVTLLGLAGEEQNREPANRRPASRELAPLLLRAGHWPLALGMLAGLLGSLVDRHAMTVTEAVAALTEELADHGVKVLDELSDAGVQRGIARTVELSLADLAASTGGTDSRDRFVSLAAFPSGTVIPYWQLQRLWGLSELRTRTEADRFVSRSLASAPHPGGLRLHDVTQDALRRQQPERLAAVSDRLLELLRPAAGWHQLPEEERPFASSLAFHLRQAGRLDELGELLRDMRFLVGRLARSGPPALEADLALYTEARPDDGYALELAALVQQEGRVLSGGLAAKDLAPGLESRMLGRPHLLEQVQHRAQARPAGGLVASHPLPDRHDAALLRSFPVHDGGQCMALDWHPDGALLATAGYGPAVQIVTADGWDVVRTIDIPGAVIHAVRWSPDGTRLAVLGDTDRFSPGAHNGNPPPPTHALCVYDALSGAELAVTAVPGTARVKSPTCCWAPDSTALAVSLGGQMHLWDLTSATAPPRPLPGIESAVPGEVYAFDWHPDHGLLAHLFAPAPDGAGLLLWSDPHSPSRPAVWRQHSFYAPATGLEWRPAGRSVALTVAGTAVLVDPVAEQVLWQHGEPWRICSTQWSPDGERLAVRTLGDDPQIRATLWQVPTDRDLALGAQPSQAAELAVGADHTLSDLLVWRPAGTAISTTSNGHSVNLWRPDGAAAADANATRRLGHVMWSPDGQTLAVHGIGRQWYALDPRNPRSGLRPCPEHPYRRRDPATRQDWAAEMGALREWESPNAPGLLVEFAPDEQTYLLGRWFEALRVLAPDGRGTTLLDSADDFRRWYRGSFTPAGDRVVVAAADNSWRRTALTLWNLTGAPEEPPVASWTTDRDEGPGPRVAHVRQVTASRTHAAVAADPGLIGLFDLADLRCVCWIRTNGIVHDAAFSPSGDELAVVGDAGLYLFTVQTETTG
ncbi:NB-ARC domain-containing protein [Kitasatospora azatica]|uniref:NB-ARC domain-containing protein n=1 Tax=Kitasatospora azatica TaxID=58347 RepID=UPI0018DD665E|nr:NB-ARC domain-containing protein [Kitasatospora azatica]